jgi:elongation factor G
MRVYRFRIAPEIATFSVAHATDGDWQSWQRLEEALKRLLADATGSYLCQMPTERLFCASATQCAYAREQLSAEIGDAVRVGPVHAGYRETVSGVASAEARYVHQTGCPGHFAIVMLRIEPLAGSDEILCENEIAPITAQQALDQAQYDTIPGKWIPAVFKGIEQAAHSSPIYGYPVAGARVVLAGGRYHPVDSRALSFQIAAARAFTDALQHAGTTLVAL